LSQSAASDASMIRLQDLEATIAGNVSTLSISLVRSIEQLLEGNEAVRRYTATMQNELTKRRLGLSTLLDVVNIEDRQNNALLNEVQLQQNYANAIAQLRFELGMLVKKRDDVYDVSVSDLLSPEIAAPEK
jgi:outer membrane protein TolC